MNTSTFMESLSGKSESEAAEMTMKLLTAMPPERYFEHMANMETLWKQHGEEREREEIVCRLLASGMPAAEIAVVLCKRVAEIEIIEQNNAATKIPEYVKKLKERRRRRENQK